MYFHEYANEIIFISDHATMTILDENSIFIFLMIFSYFLSFLLIFMNTEIMQI